MNCEIRRGDSRCSYVTDARMGELSSLEATGGQGSPYAPSTAINAVKTTVSRAGESAIRYRLKIIVKPVLFLRLWQL
jgi:hypothetical protein